MSTTRVSAGLYTCDPAAARKLMQCTMHQRSIPIRTTPVQEIPMLRGRRWLVNNDKPVNICTDMKSNSAKIKPNRQHANPTVKALPIFKHDDPSRYAMFMCGTEPLHGFDCSKGPCCAQHNNRLHVVRKAHTQSGQTLPPQKRRACVQETCVVSIGLGAWLRAKDKRSNSMREAR